MRILLIINQPFSPESDRGSHAKPISDPHLKPITSLFFAEEKGGRKRRTVIGIEENGEVGRERRWTKPPGTLLPEGG
jgi:hypothetical protein